MGHYRLKYLKEISDNNTVKHFAKDFFIWLNSDKDAQYHRGMALYLMWNEFCWVKPRTDKEKGLCQRILFHLGEARELDADIPLPISAWEEIAELSGMPSDTVRGPNIDTNITIGYRRNDIMMSFPDGWKARLPGRFLEAEDDGHAFWDMIKCLAQKALPPLAWCGII